MIVDKFGEIQAYEGLDRAPILYQKRPIADGKSRGGAPLCIPNFGTAPESGRGWEKTRLPRHGLVRLLPTERPEMEPKYQQVQGLSRYQLAFPAEDRFPWKHSVEIALTEGVVTGRYNHLVHRVAITNQELDHEHGRMPLSFGWHPYFATHGQPFRLSLGREVIATEETDLAGSFHTEQMLGLTLETACGVVDIASNGYDRWVIWSDNTREYICLEPVAGYQSGFHLASLESISAMVSVRYTPKG